MQDTTTSNNRDDDALIWGAEAIGREIGRTARQAYQLLITRKIDATKCGPIWVTTQLKARQSVLGGGGEAASK